jgi:hypothetical protein
MTDLNNTLPAINNLALTFGCLDDMPENQKVYPQPNTQDQGWAFHCYEWLSFFT